MVRQFFLENVCPTADVLAWSSRCLGQPYSSILSFSYGKDGPIHAQLRKNSNPLFHQLHRTPGQPKGYVGGR